MTLAAVTVDPDAVNSWIVLIVGASAAVGALYKALQRVIRREVSTLRDELATVREGARQLGPNGGTHMYDKVNKLIESDKHRGRDIAELKDALNDVAEGQKSLQRAMHDHVQNGPPRRRLRLFG